MQQGKSPNPAPCPLPPTQWLGTWAQLAMLWEALQAMLQQHGDEPVQVGHLAGAEANMSWQLSFQNSGSLETLCSGCKLCLCQSFPSSGGLLAPVPNSSTCPTLAVCHTAPLSTTAHRSVSPALGLLSPLPVTRRPGALYLSYTLEPLKDGFRNFSKTRSCLPRV